jgi:hypothetical protein
LEDTAIPRESAFIILLQNCIEGQSCWEITCAPLQ